MTNPTPEEVEAWLAPLIGKITIRWSELQELVYMIFQALLLDDARAHAIFFSVKSDAAQRDMTLAAAEAVLPEIEFLLIDEMRALFGLVGKAAGRRNDAVHTQWFIHPDLPGGLHVPRSSRLHGKDARQALEQCLAEIKPLTERMSKLWFAIKTKIDDHQRWLVRKTVAEGIAKGLRRSPDTAES